MKQTRNRFDEPLRYGSFGGSAEAAAPGKRTLTAELAFPAHATDDAATLDGLEDAGGQGTIDPATMQALYYGINPPRHAEKAYQVGDPAPPLHPRPTTVGRSGVIVALATTIYNRPPFGRIAQFSICDRSGRCLHAASVKTPGRLDIPGFRPGTEVLIRPETPGTMVKLLTPEQIAGADDDRA